MAVFSLFGWTAGPAFGKVRAAMNRPERLTQNLEAKIAAKEARAPKRVGKKTKRWKKAREAAKAPAATEG